MSNFTFEKFSTNKNKSNSFEQEEELYKKFSPKQSTVSNILNYSKAYRTTNSKYLEHLELTLN